MRARDTPVHSLVYPGNLSPFSIPPRLIPLTDLRALQAEWDAEALAEQQSAEAAALVERATPGLDRLSFWLTAAAAALGLWLLIFNGARWWFGA